jgi:epoxyqueuosine reductase
MPDVASRLTSGALKARALALGFDLCGVARAERHPKLARLSSWIDDGCAGTMHYLSTSLDERLDPQAFLPTARSVVSLAVVYNTGQPYSNQATASPGTASIARYAWGDDYHDVMRARVHALVTWMADVAGPGLEALTCVDDGPVQERVFAEQAGLGWIGKNTCVINPRLGSWIFLAAVVTNAALEPDAAAVDQCGTCTRCLDACPTGAISEPYTVDATRCLSYLTIERREPVDEGLRPAIHTQIVGCDICQDVCPWNRRAAVSADAAWQPRAGLAFPAVMELCERSDEAWRPLLAGSALRRAGLRRIRRSLAYAAAALPLPEAARALDALDRQPSARHEDVASAIAWARTRLQAGESTPSR